MNVQLIEKTSSNDERVLADEDCALAVCAIDPASGAQVEVRRIGEGKLAIVITGGRVTMHPRNAAVWIEVES